MEELCWWVGDLVVPQEEAPCMLQHLVSSGQSLQLSTNARNPCALVRGSCSQVGHTTLTVQSPKQSKRKLFILWFISTSPDSEPRCFLDHQHNRQDAPATAREPRLSSMWGRQTQSCACYHKSFKGKEISLPWDALQAQKMENFTPIRQSAPLKILYQFFLYKV